MPGIADHGVGIDDAIESSRLHPTVTKQVGYASSSHFISEFGSRFGMTPRAYQDVEARQRLARTAVIGA